MSRTLISAFAAGVLSVVALESVRPMQEPRYESRTHQFWHGYGSFPTLNGHFEVANSGRAIVASGAACRKCGRIEPRAFLPGDADVYTSNKFVHRQPWLDRNIVVSDADLSVPLPSDVMQRD